jgi:alanine racemase
MHDSPILMTDEIDEALAVRSDVKQLFPRPQQHLDFTRTGIMIFGL